MMPSSVPVAMPSAPPSKTARGHWHALVTLLLLFPWLASSMPVRAQDVSCQFQLGFQTLHDLDPVDVGNCVEDETHDPVSGDALQHTTKGLLVWRKADNWTAFTNGYHTWINGPNGLVMRLNSERFSWEANPQGLPLVDGNAGGAQVPTGFSWANPGPYRSPGWTEFHMQSFTSTQAVVFAYFFYWYRYAHIQDLSRARGRDVYILHPVDFPQWDFTSQAFYERQFTDMLAAGIDVALPDYWGEPGQYNKPVAPAPELNLFSTQGLPPMVAALQSLAARGTPLKVGLFIDTTIMQDQDLTTERGKQFFYVTIRDYYSRIPPNLWAAIDGKPIVWLYDTQHVAAFDQSTFDYVSDQFAADFGGLRPYVVREWQWYASKNTTPPNQPIQTDGLYNWGAAPSGFNADTRFTVAEVGPGFDNAHFGRPNGLVADRRGGQYYNDNLERALASGRRLLAIETWDELGETSGIFDSVEYSRQYIDLTRQYADRLKAKYATSG